MDSREAERECCLKRVVVTGRSATDILSAAPLKDWLLVDPLTEACTNLPVCTTPAPSGLLGLTVISCKFSSKPLPLANS